MKIPKASLQVLKPKSRQIRRLQTKHCHRYHVYKCLAEARQGHFLKREKAEGRPRRHRSKPLVVHFSSSKKLQTSRLRAMRMTHLISAKNVERVSQPRMRETKPRQKQKAGASEVNESKTRKSRKLSEMSYRKNIVEETATLLFV